jgi:hypothetical protein
VLPTLRKERERRGSRPEFFFIPATPDGSKLEPRSRGWEAMATRTAFLLQPLRILPALLCVIWLLGTLAAQHGGGGGHSGGGHFGGGHASGSHFDGSHSGGRFGWRHFGFGKHSGRHVGSAASSTSDASARERSSLWNVPTAARTQSISRIPSTLFWSPPLVPRGQASFASHAMRLHRGSFYNRPHRFSPSGCFFNGVTQVCFFEPFFPLFCFSGGFYSFDFGFGGDSLDLDNLNSQELMQSEMSAVSPANPPDDGTAAGNSPARPGVMVGGATDNQAPGRGVFLLVLNNGAGYAVIDYWVADGYLEYISADGTRSHIPLEALDLQNTVSQNAPRGVPFVLRSAPAQNR